MKPRCRGHSRDSQDAVMALNIADLFEHAVDAVPERLALVIGDDRLTYAELDAAANRVAHHLVAAGVQPGEHVGLMARNTVHHVAAMLGTFKARMVPININYRYVEGELAIGRASCRERVCQYG